MPDKVPKIIWYQRSPTLFLSFSCDGATGQPDMKMVTDTEIFFRWGDYHFNATFTKPVDPDGANWIELSGTKNKGKIELEVPKAAAAHWTVLFSGAKLKNVGINFDFWMEEDEEIADANREAKVVTATAEAYVKGRMCKGWQPTREDWNNTLAKYRPLTAQLSGRKIAISCSNKAPDPKFAKELETALKAVGADARTLIKFPVKTWLEQCVWAADSADVAVVVYSANYDAGNVACAEMFLIKESNRPFVRVCIDDADHVGYAATAADAVKLLQEADAGIALDQKSRVLCNFDPVSWGYNAMDGAGKDAYGKIQKLWTKKEASLDVFVTAGACPTQQNIGESKEVEELKAMISSGAPSQRRR